MTFKKTHKKIIVVAMSALLVVSPILGGCASTQPQQQSSTQSVDVQSKSPHSVALSAALSLIDKAGDNIKATFDLTALNGTFAENISRSDVKLGMDLTNAKVDSIKRGSDSASATLVVEFPSKGRAPEAVKGYGDIALSANAIKDASGNSGASVTPAVVSLASDNMLRGDDASFKMPVSKKEFDTYTKYFNVIGKSLGLGDEISQMSETEKYISQYLGIGESIAKGNYIEAGMSFLSSLGLIDLSGSDAINMKLDKIISMLGVIEAKIDAQTELIQEISAKIDGTQVAAFKKELGELKNYVGYVNAYLGNAADQLKAEGVESNATEVFRTKMSVDNAIRVIQEVQGVNSAMYKTISQTEAQKLCDQVKSSNEQYQQWLEEQKQIEEQSKQEAQKLEDEVVDSPGNDNNYSSPTNRMSPVAYGGKTRTASNMTAKNAKPANSAQLRFAAETTKSTSSSSSTTTSSQPKMYGMKEYTAKLLAKAKEIGDTGTISYDAATNGLVEHFSSVVSMLQLTNEQNPLSYYYSYMSQLYNFDTQAYIQTGIFMKDIEEVMDNVVALLYTTTDPSNTQMLATFKDQYTQGVQVLRAHAPQEPDWTAPYSYVLASKVHLQAGIQRDADEDWVPNMPGAAAGDFAAKIRESSLADELISASFDQYYVDGHCNLDNFDYEQKQGVYVPIAYKLPENPSVDQLFTYSDDMMAASPQNEQFFSGLTEGSHAINADFIQQAAANEFCRGLAFDNYNGKSDFDGTWINNESSPVDKLIDATGLKWDGTGFRSPLYGEVQHIKINSKDTDVYRAHLMYYYWTFWFQKA